jgi:hypothetical protein
LIIILGMTKVHGLSVAVVKEQATASAKAVGLALYIPPFARCCEGWGTRAFGVGEGEQATASAIVWAVTI